MPSPLEKSLGPVQGPKTQVFWRRKILEPEVLGLPACALSFWAKCSYVPAPVSTLAKHEQVHLYVSTWDDALNIRLRGRKDSKWCIFQVSATRMLSLGVVIGAPLPILRPSSSSGR